MCPKRAVQGSVRNMEGSVQPLGWHSPFHIKIQQKKAVRTDEDKRYFE